MNSLIKYLPNISCCGNHVDNFIFSGWFGIFFSSHFHNTFSFLEPKTFKIACLVWLGILDGFRLEPILK